MSKRLILCSAVAVIMVSDAVAGEWTVTPRLAVGHVYSDNTSLRPEGSERHEFVTTIEPGLSVRGVGRRLRLNFDYNAEALIFKRDPERNALKYQIQTIGDAELYEKILFLDFRLTRSQENVSNGANVGTDNLSSSKSRNDVTTFALTPSVRYAFGRFVNFDASYAMNAVSNETNGNRSTSAGRNTTISFSSGQAFARAPWVLTYSKNRTRSSGGTVNRFRKIEGQIRYQFTRKYGVIFRAGKERNQFASNRSNTDGKFWSYGATWNPTPRTSLETGLGRKFFSKTKFLNFSHRARRLRFTATFDESITTTRDQQLNRLLIPLIDAFGDPVLDPITGTQVEVPIDNIDSTDEVFTASRFAGTISYLGRRTNATFSVNAAFRQGQESNVSSEVVSANLSVSHALNRMTSLSSSSRAQFNSSGGNDTERYTLSLSLRRNISQSLSGTLGLVHTTSRTESANSGFVENRIQAGIFATF